jgi:ABC-type proline/glycine betaine transport system ATPase subunit
VVFVTHDIDEAFLLGDQVVIMQRGGKISQAASPSEILARPPTRSWPTSWAPTAASARCT